MFAYQASLLFSTFAGILIGTVIFLNAPQSRSNITLSLFNLAVGAWCFGQFMGEISSGMAAVLFWTRLNISAAVLIPALYLVFVYAFTDKLKGKSGILTAVGLIDLILLVLVPTKYFIQDISSTEYFTYFPKGGPAYYVFAFFFFAVIITGLTSLFRSYVLAEGVKKNQAAYIFLASLVGFAGGSTRFFPVFGINIYPFGMLIMPLYAFITAYAIIRHRLFDIKIVLRKILTYLFLFIILSSLAAIVQVLFAGAAWAAYLPGVLIVSALFTLAFEPAMILSRRIIDGAVFKGRPDYYAVLKELSSILSSSIKPDEIIRLALDVLLKAAKPQAIAFYAAENNKFMRKSQKGKMGMFPVEIFPAGEIKEVSIVNYEDNGGTAPVSPGAALFVPIRSKEGMLGSIVLSGKASKEMWNGEDIDFLKAASGQLGMSLENARFYESELLLQQKLMEAEKMSAISILAAGMAHEIKNPLAAMKGMVQALPENIKDEEFVGKFLDIIPRQIDRINGTVENLLRFSRSPEDIRDQNIERIDVDELTDEILELVEAQCTVSNIRIKKENQGRAIIKAEKEKLVQVFLNIILNAMESMENGGTLGISAAGRDIMIADTGSGIDKKIIKKIFDPFFTTKAKGSGLGLSVAYRIMKDMGGTIEAESSPAGSVFRIKFSKETTD